MHGYEKCISWSFQCDRISLYSRIRLERDTTLRPHELGHEGSIERESRYLTSSWFDREIAERSTWCEESIWYAYFICVCWFERAYSPLRTIIASSACIHEVGHITYPIAYCICLEFIFYIDYLVFRIRYSSIHDLQFHIVLSWSFIDVACLRPYSLLIYTTISIEVPVVFTFSCDIGADYIFCGSYESYYFIGKDLGFIDTQAYEGHVDIGIIIGYEKWLLDIPSIATIISSTIIIFYYCSEIIFFSYVWEDKSSRRRLGDADILLLGITFRRIEPYVWCDHSIFIASSICCDFHDDFLCIFFCGIYSSIYGCDFWDDIFYLEISLTCIGSSSLLATYSELYREAS